MRAKFNNKLLTVLIISLSLQLSIQFQVTAQELTGGASIESINKEVIEKEFERIWNDMSGMEHDRDILIYEFGPIMAYDNLRRVIIRKAAKNLGISIWELFGILDGLELIPEAMAENVKITEEFERVWKEIDEQKRQQFISEYGALEAYGKLKLFIAEEIIKRLGIAEENVMNLLHL